jgi:transposase-like protein
MNCVRCGSEAVTERPEVTTQGYCGFRCRDCSRQFNERSSSFMGTELSKCRHGKRRGPGGQPVC